MEETEDSYAQPNTGILVMNKAAGNDELKFRPYDKLFN